MEKTSLQPGQLVDETINKGVAKANLSTLSLAVLGFMAGVFIALAGVATIRVMAGIPAELGSLANYIGAIVFPFGLICLLLAGGELVTGNMMVVSMALYAKKITGKQWVRNIAIVTFFNLLGSLFVAYFFGYLSGTLTEGIFLEQAISTSLGRSSATWGQGFLSGIACNILVTTAVYLHFASRDFIGKIVGIFLPIMGFVLGGYQHVVANMFYIPMGIFLGGDTWANFYKNMTSVWLGNLVGGGIILAGAYFLAYKVGPKK